MLVFVYYNLHPFGKLFVYPMPAFKSMIPMYMYHLMLSEHSYLISTNFFLGIMNDEVIMRMMIDSVD